MKLSAKALKISEAWVLFAVRVDFCIFMFRVRGWGLGVRVWGLGARV